MWVIPNIEAFSLDVPMPGGTGKIPDVPAWSVREYGARVGVWRIMDVLQRHSVRGTVALNADVCDAYPEVLRAALDLRWELMGHGITNTQRLYEPGAQNVVAETMERIERATGQRPLGWLSPGLQETWTTLDELAAARAEYVADWVIDDQPMLMRAGSWELIALPYSSDINDKIAFELMHYTPDDFDVVMRRQFDVLYEEGARSGRVMAIALHPYLIGYPYRIRALDSALGYIESHDKVWFATGHEIAEAFRQSIA